MSADKQNGPVTWITGASSGIGRQLAIELALRGNPVIASARNVDALDRLAEEYGAITALPADLADDDAAAELGERLRNVSPRLDRIILNAGSCEYLDFPEPDWDAIDRVMNVNFFGVVRSLRAALPLLRASRSGNGHIVVVASQVTGAPFPRAEAYGASKAAVEYFCNSLRLDLAKENIDVSIVRPGFVDTPLTRANDFPMPFLMTTEQAVERILGRLDSRPREITFPGRLAWSLSLSRWAPRLWQKMVTS